MGEPASARAAVGVVGGGGGCEGGARDFYLKHDFVALPLQPERLFLAMATIERLVGE